MKPHPRIRKMVKWGGLAAHISVVTVWIGSGWWAVNHRTTTAAAEWRVGVLRGAAMLERTSPMGRPDQPRWRISRASGHFLWWFAGERRPDPRFYAVAMPLWVPAVALAPLTINAWVIDARARRRKRLGDCLVCGYDRRGLGVDAVCPECGAAAPRTGKTPT